MDLARTRPLDVRRALVAALAGSLLGLTVLGWGAVVVTQQEWLARSFAIDYGIYMDAVDRFSSGGGWYQARQLGGPYPIELGDVLYPPVLLYLLVPFKFLGPWLWSLIPAVVIGAVVWRHRPALWAWALIAVCLAWPYSPAKFVFGNPVIWATAALALGTLHRWPSALVLLKPTVAPFALFGVRDRRWWLALGGLAVLSLPILEPTLQYPQVLLDAQTNPVDGRGGPLYSLTEFPLMSIPLLAWLGRRHEER